MWRLQGIVAQQRGELPEAIRLLRRAAEIAVTQGSAEALAAVERDLGTALAASGDGAGARAARQRAQLLYERLGAHHAARALAALASGG